MHGLAEIKKLNAQAVREALARAKRLQALTDSAKQQPTPKEASK